MIRTPFLEIIIGCGILLLVVAAFVRFLRWASIVQQKEYRYDRLRLYLLTADGRAEFLRLLPELDDFSRTGLRRPRFTPRALVTMLIAAGALSLVIGGGAVLLPGNPLLSVFLLGLLAYALLPVVLMLAGLSGIIVREAVTRWTLWHARRVLQVHEPIVIGITGSFGKTSTKQLLARVLAEKYSTFATPSSHNTALSVARAVSSAYAGEEIAVLEYGAYKPGEIARMTRWMDPDHAIITGFTPQHLGLFGSEQAIIDAKAELVQALPAEGTVHVNAQYQGAREIARTGGHADFIPYTTAKSAVQLEDVSLDEWGRLRATWDGHTFSTQLVGSMHADTIRACISMATQLALSPAEIVQGLRAFQPTERFMRSYIGTLEDGRSILFIDDGATANSQGFQAMVDVIKHLQHQHPDVPMTLVFNGIVDLAHKHESIHRGLGEISQVFDQVWYPHAVGRESFEEGYGAPAAIRTATPQELPLETVVRAEEGDTAHDQQQIDGIMVLEGKMAGWFRAALDAQLTTTEISSS